MYNNQLTTLPASLFANSPDILTLDLSDNAIKSVPKAAFSHAVEMTSL